MTIARSLRPRKLSLAATVLTGVLLTAACGGEGSNADGSASGESCGEVPTQAPDDPDGLLSALPAEVQAAYNGYPGTVEKSAWAAWKPEGSGPYKVGIAFGPTANPFQTSLLDSVKATLEADPQVSDVVALTSPDNNVTPQLQQYRSLVQQDVDIILYQPNAPEPFVPVVDEAAKAGIPSVSIQLEVPTANSVNVLPNQWLFGAEPAAYLAGTLLDGEGSVLQVHGVPGVSADTNAFDGFAAALEQCPGVEVVGEVNGQFNPAVAKSETLKFLTTYPGEIDGVLQTAVMAPGIISAFEDQGRDVPPVTDIAAQQGSLAYWRDNSSSGYQGVGVGQGPTATGALVAQVALRMLHGDGVKVSDIVFKAPMITKDNLDQWVETDWSPSSVGGAEGPEGALASDAYLDPLFTSKS